MSSQPQFHRVFKLKSQLAVQDPDIPGTRYHHVIFVESNADGSGIKYHVTGDITTGMRYESRAYHNPQGSPTPHTSEFLGYTDAKRHPAEWDKLLSTLPPPPKQKAFNMKTMRTEPVKTWQPLTFYEPGEPRRPLRKCTEWVVEQALPALYAAGLIRSAP